MRDDMPTSVSAERPSSRLSPGEWALAGLGVAGLAGFAATFILLGVHSAADPAPPAVVQTPVERAATTGAGGGAYPVKGDPGPRGERGPAGPAGPPGNPGIRILRSDCVGGNCTVQCESDEVLLTAHCGIGRTAAVYSSHNSAVCRSRGTAKVEVVAACVRSASP